MRNIKLIKMLKLLNKKELKEFNNFIASPYCNKSKKCIELYELLYFYAPDFTNPKMDSPGFLMHISEKKNCINTLFNDLLILLEQYIAGVELREHEGIQNYFLLEGLRKRGEQKHFNLVYKRSLKKVAAKKKSIQKYHEEFLIERSRLDMLYDNKAKQEVYAEQLEKSIRAFDKYIFTNHFQLDNTIFNVVWMETSEEIDRITENIVTNSKIFSEMASVEPYKNEKLIGLHLLLRELHLNKEEKDYSRLFEALKAGYNDIGKNDYEYFYKYVVNYCIRKVLGGEDQYYKKMLDIYLFAMEVGAFVEGEYLDTNRMKNVIITSVKSGEIDLAYDFLDKYLAKVNPIYQKVLKVYCHGYLYFHKKEYDLAINCLIKCRDLKMLFELDAETILYKIYYETNQSWPFDTPIKAFTKRIKRQKNKYPGGLVKGYINFFSILQQIHKKRENPNCRKPIEQIRRELNEMTYNSDKKWLLIKLDEFK